MEAVQPKPKWNFSDAVTSVRLTATYDDMYIVDSFFLAEYIFKQSILRQPFVPMLFAVMQYASSFNSETADAASCFASPVTGAGLW